MFGFNFNTNPETFNSDIATLVKLDSNVFTAENIKEICSVVTEQDLISYFKNSLSLSKTITVENKLINKVSKLFNINEAEAETKLEEIKTKLYKASI